jgi:hypothetical protein
MKTRQSEKDLRSGVKIETVLPAMPIKQQLGQQPDINANKSLFIRTGNLVIIDRNTSRS